MEHPYLKASFTSMTSSPFNALHAVLRSSDMVTDPLKNLQPVKQLYIWLHASMNMAVSISRTASNIQMLIFTISISD
jgi:hypothetical protein